VGDTDLGKLKRLKETILSRIAEFKKQSRNCPYLKQSCYGPFPSSDGMIHSNVGCTKENYHTACTIFNCPL
jgi:hypothetical protein